MGKTFEINSLEEMCDLMCDNKIPEEECGKMTIEKAIYIIKNSAFLSTGSEFQDIEKAIEMSVEALERQSPKKITVRNKHDLFCPVCNESVVWDMKWCDNCGQRIFIGGDRMVAILEENNGK